jgi:hypothetical protein
LLKDYKVNKFIYDGNELYGHLNHQRKIISPEVDYYMIACPDTYFSEYALAYLIESVKQINNKYFVVTPQVSKVGDPDWDKITNPRYLNIPYTDYLKTDVYDLRYESKISDEEINLKLLGKCNKKM